MDTQKGLQYHGVKKHTQKSVSNSTFENKAKDEAILDFWGASCKLNRLVVGMKVIVKTSMSREIKILEQ